MATELAAVTPSPPPTAEIRTPSAPRFGYQDDWEPYTPRKSARISSQRVPARTPSPGPGHRQPASPRTAKKHNIQKIAAMTSPIQSPRKRRQPPSDTGRRVSGALTMESTANAAAALGLDESSEHALPTPSKTPQKHTSSKTTASIQTFARNLFPTELAETPKKKRGKKYSGMSLDSFTVENEEESIDIYTDSQERIPVKDDSAENPFYSKNSKNETGQPRARRRNVYIPGEGSQLVTDAARREDGMVYVFRGKRFFRKFADEQDQLDEFDDADGTSLSRSAVKPRLLFQQEKSAEALEEEEATTDVEDNIQRKTRQPETPSKAKKEVAETPEAPRFAPASPPDSKRSTRSANKLLDIGTPVKSKGRKSPFDSWPRIKEQKGQSSTKRVGEPLDQAPAKRTRA